MARVANDGRRGLYKEPRTVQRIVGTQKCGLGDTGGAHHLKTRTDERGSRLARPDPTAILGARPFTFGADLTF
jgi:hypothetical protein